LSASNYGSLIDLPTLFGLDWLFDFQPVVAWAAYVSLAADFVLFVERAWCRYACPLGAISLVGNLACCVFAARKTARLRDLLASFGQSLRYRETSAVSAAWNVWIPARAPARSK
jgi:hypothetical protein